MLVMQVPRQACTNFFYVWLHAGRQLWYHVVGTPQAQDKFVFAMPDEPEWMCGAEVTDDGMCAPLACFWLSTLSAPGNLLLASHAESLCVLSLDDNISSSAASSSLRGREFTAVLLQSSEC